jgi:hypothetical protein
MSDFRGPNVAYRRTQVAALYLKGQTIPAIAGQLNLRQQTVSQDLDALREAWTTSAMIDFDSARAREMAKIDHLECTYWSAWERSLSEKTETTSEKSELKGAVRLKAVSRKAQTTGDPAFLAGIQWCIDKRCKLLGLDAPKRYSFQSTEGFRASVIEAAVAEGLDPEVVLAQAESYFAQLRDEARA